MEQFFPSHELDHNPATKKSRDAHDRLEAAKNEIVRFSNLVKRRPADDPYALGIELQSAKLAAHDATAELRCGFKLLQGGKP